MKKNLVITTVCAASLLTVTAMESQAVDLSSVKNISNTVQTTASALTPDAARGQIKTINAQVAAANKTVAAANAVLDGVLTDKNAVATYKQNLAKANSTTDPKEKAALIKQAEKDLTAANKAYQNSEEYKKKLASLTESQINGVLNATVSLTVAASQYVAISKECTTLAMKISSNPTLAVPLASDLSELKNTISVLKTGLTQLKTTTVRATKCCDALGVGDKLKTMIDKANQNKNKTSATKKVSLPLK